MVTVLVIVLCAAVYFLLQQPSGSRDITTQETTVRLPAELAFTLAHAAIPCEVVTGEPLGVAELARTMVEGNDTACVNGEGSGAEVFPQKWIYGAVVVSMFLHGGLLHLAGNLWFLWVFGNNIEDRLGSLRFTVFYVAGGVVATIGHVVAQPNSTVPVVGASGAIAAIMGAYLIWYPRAPVLSLIPPIFVVTISARWFLCGWFFLQFLTNRDSGVAWIAHVVGFVYGVVVALAVRKHPKTAARLYPTPL